MLSTDRTDILTKSKQTIYFIISFRYKAKFGKHSWYSDACRNLLQCMTNITID